MKLPIEEIISACSYRTSRSGGKGGQNVNKVETKVELLFAVAESQLFAERYVNKILDYAGGKADTQGVIHITSEQSRSQLANKENCQKKLIKLLRQALAPKKERKATKPTKASREKRIKEKKQRSDIKATRKAIDF